MQATVYRFDPETGDGSVLTDEGVVLPFDVEAVVLGGFRHLRPGQRLTVERDDIGTIVRLSLGSINSRATR